ncbi:bifunctional methylenetetrahydrofolate dehydrogenase/methenyltetrahydrofolate cyclohydrolase FolD [Oceanobacillus sp. 143]|uniref:Bifunctional protein FolD n=1 Tax=Oceanobacillus zhaokaii TaxID=2052660 RepID=A0A345PHE4_9BACI|nr:bifunctional methylenetetrahydrofolate dehydrogenase/methenyltetrahydrofolate cyclohydrolase FolD [Oceanobacillus zhaokaii]AXI09424.1 bifunctional methylenetetrahydrofolate dehydrogenase/methenyltetrahydrofolate cyclohydrolase FolD [Oceanobacillus zhaokaii]QGS68850.1 bifunctional methylenetetrahydrofolate dehydrogenase/methenyltetrahydrofolate cyclohydrolase FolD [Oceanobacillus sp. 143]
MTAEIINGKDLAQELRIEMKEEVSELIQNGLTPHLTVVLVGDNPASRSYVKGKEKAASEVGITSSLVELPDSTTEEELFQLIQKLNEDPGVHGILVQLPLPKQIREQEVIETIAPSKDVDGFHPISIGRMMTGEDTFLPCTPYGIITMLKSRDIEIEGKHAVIIGRSNIVGKPVGQLLLNENATVTYCHSRTDDLKAYTQKADILIAAIGRANAITSDYIKEGAVVIDVGINRLDNGKLTGDVDFDGAIEKASYVTPVPKGVGPMTIAMLLKNTIKAAKGLASVGK